MKPDLTGQFYEKPVVRCLRAHRYADAMHDLGEEFVSRALEAGYVVAPWAEHADMFLAWGGCGEDLRKSYEQSLGGESISRLNVVAQVRYHAEGRPIPRVRFSGQQSPDALPAESGTPQQPAYPQPADKTHLSGAGSQTPQPNCETDL